jgi:hypothetical protein
MSFHEILGALHHPQSARVERLTTASTIPSTLGLGNLFAVSSSTPSMVSTWSSGTQRVQPSAG